VNTDCSWPQAQPFLPGPSQTCQPTTGAPIVVEWDADAPQTTCFGLSCTAAPFDIAVGSSGEVWTLARLLKAPALDVEAPLGFELLRNAAGGAPELAQMTNPEDLHDAPFDATGLAVTEDGELDWVGPTPQASGRSLLHYDRDGTRIGARALIVDVDRSAARFTTHGITVAYHYAGGLGVARFDRKGNLVYDQAGFESAFPELDGVLAFGVSSDGSVSLLLHEEQPVEDGSGTILVRLAPDGAVAWVRWLAESSFLGAVSPFDDSWAMVSQDSQQVFVESVDSDATGIWRTQIEPSFPMAIAISNQGRILLEEGPESVATVLSRDGASCSQHALGVQLLLPAGSSEFSTTNPAYVALPGERFAFAYSGSFGVLRLP
jgi:hypothetical protein